MKFFFLFGYLSLALAACPQQDTTTDYRSVVTNHTLQVGKTALAIRLFTFTKDPPFILVQLHSNETTAGEVAYEAAHHWGVPFLQFANNKTRRVSFRQGGKRFQFDPNRIFTDAGIRKTLQQNGRYTHPAFREVKRFSDSLLSILIQGKPIVAVHNNTDGRFTILHYLDAGTGEVHINDTLDADDFFITNDEKYFQLLKAENVNVVLEDVQQMRDDGSLIVACSRKQIAYINVEAQHGHRRQQAMMLKIVNRILR